MSKMSELDMATQAEDTQYQRWADDFDDRHMRDNERRMDKQWKQARAKRAQRHATYVQTLITKTNQNR